MGTGAFVAFAVTGFGCGGGSAAPTAPTLVVSTPAPTPTPTPLRSLTLDAAADATQVSPYMARIVAPQAYEVKVRPLRINVPYPSTYAHTVDIWFEDSTEYVAFAAAWLGNGRWAVYSYRTGTGWYYGRSRFELALGDTATFRITKHTANTTEFFVNGVSMEAVEGSMETAGRVYARVLGLAADVSWVPLPTSATTDLPKMAPFLCLFCPPRH